MATPAQVAANIANAQHSTGPQTEIGKAISSKNALKHGLTAQTVLLPGEDEAAYRKLRDDLVALWAPSTVTETELIQNLCDYQWRLNRCGRLEAALLSADVPDFKALDILSKHEARLKKLHSTTLKDIRDLNNVRAANYNARMTMAVTVRRADVLKGRSTNLQELGFDFSVKEVDAAINREDVYRRAQKVVSQNFMG